MSNRPNETWIRVDEIRERAERGDSFSWEDVRLLLQVIDYFEERERDICTAVGGVSDKGRYRNDIIDHLKYIYHKAGQCPGLEEAIEVYQKRIVELDTKMLQIANLATGRER